MNNRSTSYFSDQREFKLSLERFEDIKKEAYLALLQNGRILTIKAAGGSMSPFLKTEDLIGIRYKTFDGIKVGDIVAYKRPGQANIVAHRLVKKGKDKGRPFLVTKGDAVIRFGCDLPVYAEDILGKVVSRKRGGKLRNLDGYFAWMFGYIYARFLFYFPQALGFLRKLVRAWRKLRKMNYLQKTVKGGWS